MQAGISIPVHCLALAVLAVCLAGCSSESGSALGANTAPVVADITTSTTAATPVDIVLTGTDADGNALVFAVDTSPANGMLDTTLLPTATYTPDGGFTGVDSFTFHANDGTVDSNTAAVYIGVDNTAPTAANMSDAADEDTVLPLTLDGTDADGDALTWIIDDAPQHGTLATGTMPDTGYTPDADYNGGDSFTFHVSDGMAVSSTVTVTITINAVNDAPVADDKNVDTDMDIAVDITLTAADAEGDALTFAIDMSPAHGTLNTSLLPVVTYTPDTGYFGQDTFTYYADDTFDQGLPATVTIQVGPSSNWQQAPTTIEGAWHPLTSALGPDGRLHFLASKWNDENLLYGCVADGYEYSETYTDTEIESAKIAVAASGRVHFVCDTVDRNSASYPSGRQVYRTKPDTETAPDRTEVLYAGTAYAYHLGHATITVTGAGGTDIAYRGAPDETGGGMFTNVTDLFISSRDSDWNLINFMLVTGAYAESESAAVDSMGDRHFFLTVFPDYTRQKYKRWGSTGQEAELTENVIYTMIRGDSSGKAHVIGMDPGTFDCMYLNNTATAWPWVKENTGRGYGDFHAARVKMDIDGNDKLHLVFARSTDQALMHSTNASGTWNTVVIDDTEAYAFASVSCESNGVLKIIAQQIGTGTGGADRLVYITND